MRGLSLFAAIAMLSTPCFAQNGPDAGQCEQVRAAITQHGLEAARKHAMENYGLTRADLRRVEQDCGIGHRGRSSKKTSS
jgi:hypothetical protein